MTILRGKIPLRVSFSGGGTDVDPFCEKYGGSVLTSTIDKYIYISIEKRRDKFIKINSFDYNQIFKFNIKKKLTIKGNLKLVKAIINYLKPYHNGFNLSIHCDAPTGSGLGTSGCLGSLLIKMLYIFKKKKISNSKVGELALLIERELVKINGGKQDQYAGMYGGFNILRFKEKYKCKQKKIVLSKSFIDELNYNSLLIYTKKKHYSNDLLSLQKKRYEKKVGKTISALHSTNKLTKNILRLFVKEDISLIGKKLHDGWMLKKKMNPYVTTPEINSLYKKLKKIGVYGGKVLGAGGGGYMLVLLPFYLKKEAVRIIKKQKMELSDYNFENTGLQIWKVKKYKINKNTRKYFL